MTARVELRPEHLEISFPGAESLLTLKRRLTLPWSDVASVRVAPQAEMKRELGWRVGGGYFPGWFATGHYTFRGGDRRGERQLWCCYRAGDVLVVETRLRRPRRVVLQVDDPAGVAARIAAVVGTRA
jgi:hypothetical protein